MIDGAFGLSVALGLAVKSMRATPIVGADEDGYLSIEGAGRLNDLLSRQRAAWRLLSVGFLLQLIGAFGLSVHALLGHV
jgi:hypothetical protein